MKYITLKGRFVDSLPIWEEENLESLDRLLKVI